MRAYIFAGQICINFLSDRITNKEKPFPAGNIMSLSHFVGISVILKMVWINKHYSKSQDFILNCGIKVILFYPYFIDVLQLYRFNLNIPFY